MVRICTTFFCFADDCNFFLFSPRKLLTKILSKRGRKSVMFTSLQLVLNSAVFLRGAHIRHTVCVLILAFPFLLLPGISVVISQAQIIAFNY